MLALCSPALAFFYYPPSPAGPVGLSRPAISQRFVLADGERFAWARMWLDGVEVTPVADEVTGVVSYVPPAPLAAGTHQVRMEVQVSHPRQGYYYSPLKSKFAFTVAAGAVTVPPDPTAEAHAVPAHLDGQTSSWDTGRPQARSLLSAWSTSGPPGTPAAW
ncbi:MAG: hypothetical protein Q8P31_13925 [Bacillota bacterium]|nr:hypothetical protein [Bacillota bacterium]